MAGHSLISLSFSLLLEIIYFFNELLFITFSDDKMDQLTTSPVFIADGHISSYIPTRMPLRKNSTYYFLEYIHRNSFLCTPTRVFQKDTRPTAAGTCREDSWQTILR